MRTSPADPAPVRLAVAGDAAGKRLDAVVGALEAVGSRAEAQRLIEAGRVLVDGRVVPKRHLLAEGERVEVRPAPPRPAGIEPEEVPLTVRYEDAHLLVVDKPAGVVVHPSAGHRGGTLVHGLVAREIAGGGDPARPGIVHRLDRDTSGLLVVARSERAHRRLQRLLRDREIDRRYLTLVHGAAPPALTIDRTVGRDRKVRTRMAVGAADGREAVTHLRRLEDLGRFSLLEARLETGRTHQIRVHLESVGHPVVGDRLYGRRPESLGLERQFLHAARLAFPHPETGEPVEVESPLPDDLRRALALARRARGPRGEAPAR
jgi:23S rRNA pseudouridine1911/1915/1917 synthase